jgi:hypothetical protein
MVQMVGADATAAEVGELGVLIAAGHSSQVPNHHIHQGMIPDPNAMFTTAQQHC